jgi:hypothetical protein
MTLRNIYLLGKLWRTPTRLCKNIKKIKRILPGMDIEIDTEDCIGKTERGKKRAVVTLVDNYTMRV